MTRIEESGSGLGPLEDEAFLAALSGIDARLSALQLAFPLRRHAVAIRVLRLGIERLGAAATCEAWPEEAI